MLKKSITYVDYNGDSRTEDFYFNLSNAELIELEAEYTGGFSEYLERLISDRDSKKIFEVIKNLVTRSYGEKSDDGRRFVKSKETAEAFAQTEAYSVLLMELMSGEDAIVAFLTGLIPSELRAKVVEDPKFKAEMKKLKSAE